MSGSSFIGKNKERLLLLFHGENQRMLVNGKQLPLLYGKYHKMLLHNRPAIRAPLD